MTNCGFGCLRVDFILFLFPLGGIVKFHVRFLSFLNSYVDIMHLIIFSIHHYHHHHHNLIHSSSTHHGKGKNILFSSCFPRVYRSTLISEGFHINPCRLSAWLARALRQQSSHGSLVKVPIQRHSARQLRSSVACRVAG